MTTYNATVTSSMNCNSPGTTYTEASDSATETVYVGMASSCALTTSYRSAACTETPYTSTGSQDGHSGTNTVVVNSPSSCAETAVTSTIDCRSGAYTQTSTGKQGTNTVVVGKPGQCTPTIVTSTNTLPYSASGT